MNNSTTRTILFVIIAIIASTLTANASTTVTTKATQYGHTYQVTTQCTQPAPVATTHSAPFTDNQINEVINKYGISQSDLRLIVDFYSMCTPTPTYSRTTYTPQPEQCSTTTTAYCGDGILNNNEECDNDSPYCDIRTCTYNLSQPKTQPTQLVKPTYNHSLIIPTGTTLDCTPEFAARGVC